MANRIALCIGISNYSGEGIDSLPNAVADAELVHHTLTARGFDSELLENATHADIEAALQRLDGKANVDPNAPAFTVIYYAGHGYETGGLGFILPADFPGPPILVRIPRLALSTLRLVDAISGYTGPKLIILDACRSDAAIDADANDVARFMELASDLKEQYPNVVGADDLVFAFATSAGKAAGDGVNGHSRYCAALANGILSHDHSLDELLANVTQQVIRSSSMGQRPWYLSSLTHALAFSDLPVFNPVPFEIYRAPSHQNVTRLHPLSGVGHIYNIERELLFAHGHERRTVGGFDEDIQALGTHGAELYVLLASGDLLRADVHVNGDLKFKKLHKAAFDDNFAVAISPNGRTMLIVGMAGYEVVRRIGIAWKLHSKTKTPKFNVYNAKFADDDSAVLSCSSGSIIELSGLSSLTTKVLSREAPIEDRSPVHDIEIVVGGTLAVAARANGNVEFFDRLTWTPCGAISLNDATLTTAHDYAILRNQFTRDQVELYYRDKQAFAALFPDDPDILEAVDDRVGHQQLLCCTLLRDSRVLAVASAEGFVFLIDVRERKHFRTIDVGGGLGKSLRWLCADPDSNAFITLMSDGTMVRYEGMPPRF